MKKILLFIMICAFSLLTLTSCGVPVDEIKDAILSETLPLEYKVESYDDYLPSKYSYYVDREENYHFLVTYKTSSNLIKIEDPEYCYYSDEYYGSLWYDYSYRTHYVLDFANNAGKSFTVNCRYYDEDNDVEIIIDRTFVILSEDYYLVTHLKLYSGFQKWTYSNGVYSLNEREKSQYEYSNSHKVTYDSTYTVSYNRSTGIIDCLFHYKTFTSKGWDNTTTTSIDKLKYNIKTGEYFVDGEISSVQPADNSKLGKIIKAIKSFDNFS